MATKMTVVPGDREPQWIGVCADGRSMAIDQQEDRLCADGRIVDCRKLTNRMRTKDRTTTLSEYERSIRRKVSTNDVDGSNRLCAEGHKEGIGCMPMEVSMRRIDSKYEGLIHSLPEKIGFVPMESKKKKTDTAVTSVG